MDKEIKAKAKHRDVKTILADDDPTGESPILDSALAGGRRGEATAETGVIDPNVLALRRVDAEIRRLMESWVELENRLRDREGEIRRLSDWAGSLENDLRDTRQELTASRSDCERLRGEAIDQRVESENQRRQADERQGHAEALKTDLAAAQGRIEELTIELRLGSERSAQVESRLAEHRDALAGMAARLRQAENSSKGLDSEKAELAARIIDLDRRCTDLNGRCRDFEMATRQAEKELAAAGKRTRELEAEVLEARAATAQTEARLAEKSAVIESLAEQAREQEQQRANLKSEIRKAEKALAVAQRDAEAAGALKLRELQGQIDAERNRVTGLLGELQAREQAIARLQAALDSQRQKTELAENSGSRTEELLRKTSARVAALEQVEAQAAGLRDSLAKAEAAALAASAERARLLEQIAGRDAAAIDLRQRIGELEGHVQELRDQAAAVDSEFQVKRKAIAALGSEIDRLDLIQANVRKLDSMMSQQLWSKDADAAAPDHGKPRNGRLIVWLDGQKAMKYPLYKADMVIGRAHDTDIRVTGPHTSRRHAHVFIEDGAVVIEDLGSLNGITVNSEYVERRQLHDGDVLDIGGARLRYVDLDEKTGAHGSEAMAAN